ncbi:MAG: hypothetical protein FWG67_05165 [Defluviitaleaceae bacterium]|nr:hypothetical protein [Defluviitaleaceae bacterium]
MKKFKRLFLWGMCVTVGIMLSLTQEGLTADQRAVWQLIQARIDAGYHHWYELVQWAEEADITWQFHQDHAPFDTGLNAQIHQYGLVGRHVGTGPAIDAQDEETVIMAFHWVDVSHNDKIEALYHLDRTSEEAILNWLASDDREALEEHFDQIVVLEVDENGDERVEASDDQTFLFWHVTFTTLQPKETAVLTIEMHYQLTDVTTRKQMQQQLLELLEARQRVDENRNPLERERLDRRRPPLRREGE